MKKMISRRQFLTGAAATLGLAAVGCVPSFTKGSDPLLGASRADLEQLALIEKWPKIAELGPEHFEAVQGYANIMRTNEDVYNRVLEEHGDKAGAIEPLHKFLGQEGLNARVMMGIEVQKVDGAHVEGPDGLRNSQFVQLGSATYRGPRNNPTDMVRLDTPFSEYGKIVCFDQTLEMLEKSNDNYFAAGIIPLDAARREHGEANRINDGFVVMSDKNKAAFVASQLKATGYVAEVPADNVKAVPGAGYGIVQDGAFKGQRAVPCDYIADGEPFTTRPGFAVDTKTINPGRPDLTFESMANMYAQKQDLRDGIGLGRVYFGMGRAPKE